ncbi:hypothetical protein [Sphingomonas sp.]|uniref:hypothetical protein n=1 Tax=Sphingomonas sp. TaxID=28214 RepID=UPI003B005484
MFPASPALRRYNRRILLLSLVYAACLFAAVYLFKHHLIAGPLAWPVALAPAVPVIGFFVTIGRYLVEESDEYLRDQMVRQALIATGLAMAIATAWGFLENFGLVRHVDAYYVAVVWFAGLGLGACINGLAARRGAA